MSKYLNFSKLFSIVSTSLVASSVLISSPASAATFASSQGIFKFTDFSQIPTDVFADTNTNTVAIAKIGPVNADATADALFEAASLQASNSSLSSASGTGRDYLGLGESFAAIRGTFDLAENTTFSFNFTGDLTLETSIDDPAAETAKASGNVFLGLFDVSTNSLLDFFNLTANLDTSNSSDFLNFDKSNQITISNPVYTLNTGEKKESAQASVKGSFQRTFTNKTNLALVEFKVNKATVSIPEPSNLIAVLFFGGVISVARKRKR